MSEYADLTRLVEERDRYERALEGILDYWLDGAVAQVVVDHLKDLAHVALFGTHRVHAGAHHPSRVLTPEEAERWRSEILASSA